jgi:hypothetical protein
MIEEINKLKNTIMKLEHYFRLIIMSIFQRIIVNMNKTIMNQEINYNNQFFFCPVIHCKDGFNISLQINHGNYCSSENGYRTMGVDWKELEFGFPSMNEKDMWKYSEEWENTNLNTEFNVTQTVGRIPIEVMQAICDKHGGIDWDVTLSIETANDFIK